MLHKVLFVDDEASIRMTLPHILRLKGYEVKATGTVSEALAAMQKDQFDVLIADLNIGQPGDG
jgi:DNA-binding NtrC family response regulator